MTEIARKEASPELKRWYECWKTSLQDVLSQVAGRAVALKVSEEALPVLPDDLWYTVSARGTVSGEMALRVPAASGSILAQLLLGESQTAAGSPPPENKDAVIELLRQIAGHAATALSSPGVEMQFQVEASTAPSWPPSATALFSAETETSGLALEMQISVALLTALTAQSQTHAEATDNTPANYERFMDVELEVKLRFGSRRMELRDVLALNAGAVIELDRDITGPVDLLLDNRVIAQGEVVIADGKYGLRVTSVMGPCQAA